MKKVPEERQGRPCSQQPTHPPTNLNQTLTPVEMMSPNSSTTSHYTRLTATTTKSTQKLRTTLSQRQRRSYCSDGSFLPFLLPPQCCQVNETFETFIHSLIILQFSNTVIHYRLAFIQAKAYTT